MDVPPLAIHFFPDSRFLRRGGLALAVIANPLRQTNVSNHGDITHDGHGDRMPFREAHRISIDLYGRCAFIDPSMV